MSPRFLIALVTLAALAAPASGCGTSAGEGGSVPESAKLAPADAVAFVTLVADDSLAQWEKADRLLGLFPDARAALLDAERDELRQEDLMWDEDVAPALGDELVVVVTADQKPVVLLQPESEERLEALLDTSDDPVAQGTVSDWTALAETEAELDAYRAAVDRATLDSVDAFSEGMTVLPEDALARGWVDLRVLAKDVASAFEESGITGELGVDSWPGHSRGRRSTSRWASDTGDNGTSYRPL
jgi:hypothetical protein